MKLKTFFSFCVRLSRKNGSNNPAPTTMLVSYSFLLRNTSMMPTEQYSVEKHDQNTCCITIASHLNTETGEVVSNTFKTDISLLNEIEQVIMEHKMYDYRQHYAPPLQVLDGENWTLCMQFENSSYYSSGDNAYPDDCGLQIITNLVHNTITNAEIMD